MGLLVLSSYALCCLCTASLGFPYMQHAYMRNEILLREGTAGHMQGLRHYVTQNVMCYNTGKWLLTFVQG